MLGQSSNSLVDINDNNDNNDRNDSNHRNTTGNGTNNTQSSSSRPRSYGAVATSAQPSAATSAASPHLLGARTVDGADDDGGAPVRRPGTRNAGSDNTNFDPDFDADLETDLDADIDANIDAGSSADSDDSMPAQTAFLAGSNRRLAIAYAGLLLVSFTTSLEAQVTAPLAAFAVSSFHNHSLLSTVYVVQGVVNAVIKPPMAKMADVFGRFEAFVGAILLCVTGYVQMACARNVQTFAAAQILYSAGITGLQVLQQILVADTTDLRHRALLSSLPDTPFLITVWIGPTIAAAILNGASWRWGYAMWALILPVAFLPLGGSLAASAYQSRAQRRQRSRSCLGLSRPKSSSSDNGDLPSLSRSSTDRLVGRPAHKRSFQSGGKSYSSFRQLLTDLDIVGIVILSAALSMILLPLTLAGKAQGGWGNPTILASIVAGLILLIVVFPAWEARPDWAPHPLIPPTLLRSITFCAGCGVAFFFFAVFYLSVQPYFYSYLLVAHNQTVGAAGRITQTFSFTSTIAAVSASVAIRHLRRYKVFVVTGACVYLAGVSLMLVYRTADAGIGRLIATQITVGLGAGLMSVPTQIGIQASVSSTPRLVGAATAVYLTMGEAGGAVGAAISGALWGRLVPAKLEAYLPEPARQNASAIYSSVVVATSYPWGSPERIAIIRAYQESMTTLLTVAVVFCVPVLILALLMNDYRFDSSHLKSSSHDDEDNEEEGLLGSGSRTDASSSSSNTIGIFNDATTVGERTILLSHTDDE